MRRVTSKSIIARDFVFRSKCMFGGRALRDLRRFPDLIFRPQNHQKRLAAGLRPDPLGSLSAPPGPLAQWVPCKGTFYAQYGRFAAKKGGWWKVRWKKRR